MKYTQQGFTLVEMLITVALTGLVFTIAGSAIYQLSNTSGYGNDRLSVMHDLQNTAFWFDRDGRQALSAGGGQNLILTLTDNSQVRYMLEGTTLQRSAGSRSLNLARNVTALNFSIQDGLVTMNITTALGGRTTESVQGIYQVHMRPLY
jgi:prepilin-type N-terminal cleavage/methylation domain-containing protein